MAVFLSIRTASLPFFPRTAVGLPPSAACCPCLSGTRADTVPSLSLPDGAKNSVQRLHNAADPRDRLSMATEERLRKRGHMRRDTRNSVRCFHASSHTNFSQRANISFSTRSGHRLIPVKSVSGGWSQPSHPPRRPALPGCPDRRGARCKVSPLSSPTGFPET